MPDFDIVKKSKIDHTFRVAKVMGDFDLNVSESCERFCGKLDLPDKWNIGVIVGNSGTGKSTIAKELFNGKIISGFEYGATSVIDDMPKDAPVEKIEKMFYAVGFGSVPSWLKPYSVLSNGEKMRVDLARAMLEQDEICFDEFTSVVDRTVASSLCLALQKSVRLQDKKFVAITCHYDILDWIKPDWVFDTGTMQMDFQSARRGTRNLMSNPAGEKNGESLGNIII